LAADGAGPGGAPDGIVDEWDYLYWKANFGASSHLAVGAVIDRSSLNVPESGGIVLLSICGSAAYIGHGRRFRLAHSRNYRGQEI
jgi:hypothetical protein